MTEIIKKWHTIAENTKSYLSENVKELVLTKGIANCVVNADGDLFGNIDNLLNISLLTPLLLDDDEHLLPPTERCAFWYQQHIQNVAPYFAYAQAKMKSLTDEELKKLTELCGWMHQPQLVSLCFQLLMTNRNANDEDNFLNSHECLLLISAGLERALGNLFLYGDRKRKVPSLLRDLLASDELLLLLGQSQVILLQLLLGNPLSLNLRNLIWHGFVEPAELDTHRYASVLLLLCAAIGRHLHDGRSITVNQITPRRCATLKPLPNWSDFVSQELLLEAVSTARGIPASRKAVWRRAIALHQKGSYGRCSALIIPEIEHTLRLIYCCANALCPSRALTAESVIHYTTLDVILECQPSNRITAFLGNNIYSALIDAFVEVEGPRIRDRLSHGECSLFDIDAHVSSHLLALSLALLWLADTGRPAFQMPVYSPHYSPPVLFHRQLMRTMEAVGDWLAQLVDTNCDNQPTVVDLTLWPTESIPLLTNWLENWSSRVNQLLIDHLKENNRSRPADNPLAGTWRPMMSQLALGCQRLTAYRSSTNSLTIKRSRQRSSQARLDSYMAIFIRAVQLSMLLPVAVCLGGVVIDDDPHGKVIRRVKRSVTRWADNFAIAATNKRWIELSTCAQELIQSTQRLPIVFHR